MRPKKANKLGEKVSKGKGLSYLDHLSELRRRMLVVLLVFVLCFLLAFWWSEFLYQILVFPLKLLYDKQGRALSLVYTALPEAFFAYVKISLFAAFFAGLPIFFMELYRFVIPALKRHERAVFLPVFVLSPLLFFAGALVAYFFVIPGGFSVLFEL